MHTYPFRTERLYLWKKQSAFTHPVEQLEIPLSFCIPKKTFDEWANAVARCLYMVGLRPGDIFQNSSGYGMFTGGLGFQYGAERLGNA